MNNTIWGNERSGKTIPLSDLSAFIKTKFESTNKDVVTPLNNIVKNYQIKGMNNDMFIGSIAYGLVIDTEKEERDNTLMDLIYLIRNPNHKVSKNTNNIYKSIKML